MLTKAPDRDLIALITLPLLPISPGTHWLGISMDSVILLSEGEDDVVIGAKELGVEYEGCARYGFC